METRRLPIGEDLFEKLRRQECYYVDKTNFISSLLRNHALVNLFTRPRRFGKTLTMSMLKTFFEIGGDPSLFDGTKITEDTALCDEHMLQYPVVFLTLRMIEGRFFNKAYETLRRVIKREANRFYFLLESSQLRTTELTSYTRILNEEDTKEDIEGSLLLFTELLARHYGKNVIVLIDEYDVPLDKAFQNGYYDEMIDLIRSLLGQVLKSNPYLHFAVLTGCLRVSKESIFTGLNNLYVDTIADTRYEEYFGFTDAEVQTILTDYGFAERYEDTKAWYNGYRFGDVQIYCPWDIINYCYSLRANRNAEPQSYWMNTSGNDLVKRFVDQADETTRLEIEKLIAGEAIVKTITQTLTYNELEDSIDHLWSVLFMTGYLTHSGKEGSAFRLVIPNNEVREIFLEKIQKWFTQRVALNRDLAESLYTAFLEGETQTIEDRLNGFMSGMISIQDTKAHHGKKENFYHGMLLGLLRLGQGWTVWSNAESGDGFSDLLVKQHNLRNGFVIEVKYANSFNDLTPASERALAQIEQNQYTARLEEEGVRNIRKYGIAFFKKRCTVIIAP